MDKGLERRAITPIISSVLLLLLAVGLGIFVMSWGNAAGGIPGTCSNVNLKVSEINSKPQICMEGNTLNTILENDGSTKIDGIEYVYIGTETKTGILKSEILGGQFQKENLSLEENGNLLKARFIPIVGNQRCINQKVDIDTPGAC